MKRYDCYPVEREGEWWSESIETKDGRFCEWTDVEPIINELAAFTEGKPSQMLLDDMVYFLERSNFGLLPPDGGDGAEKDALESLNWLRRIATMKREADE
jgi:hypothetical protein